MTLMKLNTMNIKNLYTTAAVCLLLAVQSSCTKNFQSINSNPNGVTDEMMERDGYSIRASLIGMASAVISPDVNTTQFTECLLGGTQAGYMADANSGWNNTISLYNPTDNWTNVFMKSDRMIPLLYTSYKQLHRVTEDPVILSVGEIIKVAAMHRVTDTYGPIPYSKIATNGDISAPYDSQEDVYKAMFAELNGAIAVLDENRNNNFASSADPLYGGNVDKWIKFANSLKLRLAMRISYASPQLSKEMAESAVMHEVGVFTANDDNAAFRLWGTDGNPLNVAVEYNMTKIHADGTPCTTESGDSHVAADIVCYMNGYADPRREAYFTRDEWYSETGFTGMRRGIEVPDHSEYGHKYSGFKLNVNDPAIWMNAAEVAFLKAEAAAVFAYNMGESAQQAYERGIRLSFEQWGVKGADEYIADAYNVPATYLDPASTNSYGQRLSNISVAWNDSADIEEMQERIITQKWIANWLLGNEAWADLRRTGYPRLIPVLVNRSNGIVDSEAGARRMAYPADEAVSNSENYQYAVTTLLNGADNMATRLWFDCKENNPSYSR